MRPFNDHRRSGKHCISTSLMFPKRIYRSVKSPGISPVRTNIMIHIKASSEHNWHKNAKLFHALLNMVRTDVVRDDEGLFSWFLLHNQSLNHKYPCWKLFGWVLLRSVSYAILSSFLFFLKSIFQWKYVINLVLIDVLFSS